MIGSISAEDAAYIAGYIDGDGCIYISSNKNKRCGHSPRITATSADRRYVEYLQDTIGGTVSKHEPKEASNSVPRYLYQIVGQRALDLAAVILPYSRIKQDELRILIDYGNIPKCPNSGVTDTVYNQREDSRMRMIESRNESTRKVQEYQAAN
jgi:hypothetical protein